MADNDSSKLPKSFTFHNGYKMPSVGLGCWMGVAGGGQAVEDMVRTALKLGYRHFDTAAGYENEEHVGKAIRESGIPRSEIFVTTKLHSQDHGNVKAAFEKSLKNLGCDYVDLYLMHWPQAQDSNGRILQPHEEPTFVQTWLEMEKLLETGYVKSIGVSNFSIKTLDALLSQVNIAPVINQVQLHPCLPQFDLLEYCKSKNIILTAYCPLGRANSPFFSDDTCLEIAKRNNITVGQVLLSWGVQRGTSVIPKSVREERLVQNLAVTKLSDQDMVALDTLHKKPGMHRQLVVSPLYNTETGITNGWTHEQLGWKLDKTGNWIG